MIVLYGVALSGPTMLSHTLYHRAVALDQQIGMVHFFQEGPEFCGGDLFYLCKRFHSNPDGNLGDPDYIKGDIYDIQSRLCQTSDSLGILPELQASKTSSQ